MMDNKDELQEFDLDDILNEFHEEPQEEAPELPELTDMPELSSDEDSQEDDLDLPDLSAPEDAEGAEDAEDDDLDLSGLDLPELEQADMDSDETADDTAAYEPFFEDSEEVTVSEDDTLEFDLSEDESHSAPAEPAFQTEETFIPAPIVFTPRSRLKELKKKLVAGPEKRYYALSEVGTTKLQIALLINVLLVALCAGVTTLFVLDMIPENRLRLVIFSQVLCMMLSALFGSSLMMDSVGDLLKGRFTLNTLLTLTFAACMVDGAFCLMELRVPCCAAFCLEMTMALWARLQQRNTELSQMDTMRKAVRLHGLVRVSDYFQGKDGLLRTEGEVEDFMETYDRTSGPQLVQSIYGGLSLLACICIAVFAGLFHGLSMGVQILSTSLLVAVPATFFISVSRPTAILEQRLHMVGAVLCGWQGVKGLGGKVAFPLNDHDLFPQGSTKLNGVKFYGNRNPDDVVSYSTSLISIAGGDLVPVFKQLLSSRGASEYPVENFQNYGDGGIGGEICGEPVLLGSLNFLQDMGVEIPEGTMVNQAVYVAVDGLLCAVYAITYAKMRSSAAGLVTLCGYSKLTPVMLCDDFMLTESFLQAKFDIKTRRMAFPDREVSQQLRQVQPAPEAPVLAMTTREELVSAAYAVTGARALRTAAKLGVTIHLIGGILGMLIMLVLALLGNTDLLTPTNILLYQLVWAIPGLLVTEWTRIV